MKNFIFSPECTQRNILCEQPDDFQCWRKRYHLAQAVAFTLAEFFLPLFAGKRKCAFTLAEVLITLGIIGVVAAMTLPTLMQKRTNAEVEAKLKKIYSVMNQAILLSENDNGPKEYWDFGCTSDSESNPNDDCGKVFEKYFIPYLKKITVDSFTNTLGYNTLISFPDGSILIGKQNINTAPNAIDFYYYPNGKNFNKETFAGRDENGVNRKDSGKTFFSFRFAPSLNTSENKYHFKNGFEPYKWHVEDLTKEGLTDNAYQGYGCTPNGTIKAYCTALIQLNGWKIPNNYPFTVK